MVESPAYQDAVEKILEDFLRSHENALSFPVSDAVAFAAANLPERPEGDQFKRLERDIELILEGDLRVFYRSGAPVCYVRAAFFQNAKFKIRPSALEIKEGILFYGARFAPFCSDAVFADEYTLTSADSKSPYRPQSYPVQFSQVAKQFQMLGRSTMIDCIVADHSENYQILRNASNPEKALVKLTAFNLAAFFHKYGFKEGDAIIVTVRNWFTGSFSLEYMPADQLASQDEIETWITDFEEGLIQAYEEYGEYLEIPDQVAHAYLCAYLQQRDLRDRPALSLEEYPALMRDITIRRDGPEWTLVPVDEPSVSGGFAEEDFHDHEDHDECSCGHHHEEKPQQLRAEDFSASGSRLDSLENMLEDLSAPLDYIEIYAMVQDDLANGQESSAEFTRKLIDFMGVKFADDAQEAAFCNYVEDCWEEAAERFDPVIEEPKTPLRTRLLDLNSKRLDFARSVVEEYHGSTMPKDLVAEMKDFHARILNTLGLLNADSSLPEGSAYEQLELRIGDLEDAWDTFENKYE